ncbi:hypothetical protein AB0I22_19425 [Streptomyces sp. NPDC050610]|uniref:hypothetical protein n=1 Tax=Streptomyces sp. NPDC050610 TaxID=3157097 RepID=UPI0034418072
MPEANDLVYDTKVGRDAVVVAEPGTYALDEAYLRPPCGQGPGWGAKVCDLEPLMLHAVTGWRE